MNAEIKTNRLAMISFISGLTGLLLGLIIFAIYNLTDPADQILFIIDGVLITGRNLLVLAALVTGILALMDLKKKGQAEKGKFFAWAGIVLGAGWLVLGILVGLIFLISAMAN